MKEIKRMKSKLKATEINLNIKISACMSHFERALRQDFMHLNTQ